MEQNKTQFITRFMQKNIPSKLFLTVSGIILLSSVFGFVAGAGAVFYLSGNLPELFQNFSRQVSGPAIQQLQQTDKLNYIPQDLHEDAVIRAVKNASPAVVSIVASKDVPVFEQNYTNPFEEFFGEGFPFFELQIPERRQRGTEKREISAGTGFVVSEDGTILTNKHVVSIEDAEYTVYTNDGKKFQAKVLATDSVQDLAVLKIDSPQALPTVELGDSGNLQIGQTVIAIGNALGEFRNTVSVGVISGLQRTITAYGGGLTETIEDVIQTDAAINEGNSGGPLLNLAGEVVGINTAIVYNAQNIGFAIPINQAKRDMEQIRTSGKISHPYLGVWYTLITPELQKLYELSVDYGVWIGRNSQGITTRESVVPGSPAARAGLRADDIILEISGEKITQDNSLAKIIQKYNPGDTITVKILREGKEMAFSVNLSERE